MVKSNEGLPADPSAQASVRKQPWETPTVVATAMNTASKTKSPGAEEPDFGPS